VSKESRWAKPLFLALAAVAVLVLAFLVGRLMGPGEKPAEKPVASAPRAEAPKAAPVPAPSEPATEPPAPESKPRPRKKVESAPRPEPTPAAPTAGELRIDSDVPGAMVFLDRKFLGNAPVTAHDVAPGSHLINASADGYDGVSETVQVVPGPADVMLKFKEIRLNEAIEVVHKHGVGSCEGRLLANPTGVRYETANKNDAFSISFADIEQFEVDYLKKNLKLKQRGGKTWNFTTRAENADPLFVFHRNVEKVRKQVSK
jgi:hypothetical protein